MASEETKPGRGPGPSAASAPRGVPFGRYVISRRLGKGGMGEVFLADQLGPLGPVRPVALKRMLPRFASDPQVVRAFLEEMSTAALLNHPNIATTYDFGEVEGVYFLALEYVDGITLDALLAKLGPLPVPEALAIVRAALDALTHAHAVRDPSGAVRTVVHSDVSPHNLMISVDGAVKLLDFGLARTELAALGGPVRGKLGYVAPEQASGAPPDRRFDLYALGVVLYELLTGVRPIAEPTPERAVEAAQRRAWRPLAALRPEAAPLAAIVERALEPAPERRFQTAAELAAALEPALRRFGSAGRDRLAALVARAGGPPRRTAEPHVELTGTGVAIEALRAPAAADRAPRDTLPPPARDTEDTPPRATRDTLPPPSRGSRSSPPRVHVVLAAVLTVSAGVGAGWLTERVLTEAPAPLAPPQVALARTTSVAARPEPAEVAAEVRPRAEPRSDEALAARDEGEDVRAALRAEGEVEETGRPERKASEPRREKVRRPPSPPRGAAAARGEPRERATNAPTSGLGILSVRTTPWSRVSLDGRALGDGVVASRPVPAGRHVLTLSPGDDDYPPRSVDLEIKAGISTRVFVDFVAGTVRVDPP